MVGLIWKLQTSTVPHKGFGDQFSTVSAQSANVWTPRFINGGFTNLFSTNGLDTKIFLWLRRSQAKLGRGIFCVQKIREKKSPFMKRGVQTFANCDETVENWSPKPLWGPVEVCSFQMSPTMASYDVRWRRNRVHADFGHSRCPALYVIKTKKSPHIICIN